MSDRFSVPPASPTSPLFAALPTFEPPPALWLRIERARRRPERARRWLALAAAAGVGAIALAGWQAFSGTGLDRGVRTEVPLAATSAIDADDVAVNGAHESAGIGAALSASMERSHALERALTLARASGVVMQVALEGELARIDARLQRAYDRGAPPRELATLWAERADTLETLLAAYRHPAALRI